ncbi:MAG: response regulator [Bryobacteraceae bacterium]|nr:response regulator [Bryobacteraceae bacterium]
MNSKVVLVEDNSADVYLILEAFREHNLAIDVEVIADGEHAGRYFSEPGDSPDLVLLDLNLPKTNGLELLRAIREGERCPGVPVMVLTSSDSPQDRARALEAGANSFRRKASELDAFLEIGRDVKEMLGRAKSSAMG